jgi:hypothetical protein
MADDPRNVPIYVAKENIERFRKLLAVAGLADADRVKLLGFLAEQEYRLSAARTPKDYLREALA